MAKQSLFSACKRVFRDGISGTYTVGNNDIFLELYSQQDIDQNNEIGNSSEENIVVVAGDTITIPEGYTLTPVKPKKSLVIICNTFVNNGTVSMYQKAPNVLPHDLFIIEKNDANSSVDIVIPAYANNSVGNTTGNGYSGLDGNNGINRQCGSGGTGATVYGSPSGNTLPLSGSGYAFGGGAGTGAMACYTEYHPSYINVDSTYPMRASTFEDTGYYRDMTGGAHCSCAGGIGNPNGKPSNRNPIEYASFGCGGRVIIFCCNFINNGIITVNGSESALTTTYDAVPGGASGAGAIDVFYTSLNTEGTLSATGGIGSSIKFGSFQGKAGSGGNGSITLTPWVKSSVLKPIAKYMSKENMVYFLTNYIQRLKQGED